MSDNIYLKLNMTTNYNINRYPSRTNARATPLVWSICVVTQLGPITHFSKFLCVFFYFSMQN